MKAYSKDYREAILLAYDAGEGTRPELARRFKVSVRFIDKLVRQRREEGTIEAKQRGKGKPAFDAMARQQLIAKVRQQPDLTLEQLAQWAYDELGIVCSRGAVENALKKEAFTFKKRRSKRANSVAPTWPKNAKTGKKR